MSHTSAASLPCLFLSFLFYLPLLSQLELPGSPTLPSQSTTSSGGILPGCTGSQTLLYFPRTAFLFRIFRLCAFRPLTLLFSRSPIPPGLLTSQRYWLVLLSFFTSPLPYRSTQHRAIKLLQAHMLLLSKQKALICIYIFFSVWDHSAGKRDPYPLPWMLEDRRRRPGALY